MRKLIPVLIVLLLVSSAYAQTAMQTASSSLKGAYNYFITFSPVLLIVFGVILLIAGPFAKYIGIILIIFALIELLLMFIG